MDSRLMTKALFFLCLGMISSCGNVDDHTGYLDNDLIGEWSEHGGSKAGLRYSSLNQINVMNVHKLRVAWTYKSGDYSNGDAQSNKTTFAATPILVDERLVFCTPFNRIIALNPSTGEELWVYNPKVENKKFSETPSPRVCRGVAYWQESKTDDEPKEICQSRIFAATMDSDLIAVDAQTGDVCKEFGDEGRVSLRRGNKNVANWERYPTSPPIVVRNTVIVGALVADNIKVDAPSGVVFAFNAKTGELRWAWNADSDVAYAPDVEEYRSGTPNVWSLMSADDERGLVFLPTGNPAPDLFGGLRDGLDRYGSSTVAIDVETGTVRWAFQSVHNDVWDYDVASQPVLFELEGVGGGVPGVAQATKMGHIFLLNRENGKPLYPVEERPVPQSGVVGESLASTQPFPTHPAPLEINLSEEKLFGFTPYDRKFCVNRFKKYRYDGIFTPPTEQGSIQYPSSIGGANWGSVAIDPRTAVLFINESHVAQIVQLIPRQDYAAKAEGLGGFPNEYYPMSGAPYGAKRSLFISNFGAPCTPTPWGTLTAIDLKSGEKKWSVPLGTTRDVAPFPLWFNSGTPNLGGSIVTAGDLVFVGATMDKFFRGFDAKTGKEVWRYRLPYTAGSTPMTYRIGSDDKQYVVIAAGGHVWSESGDALIAFALSE